MSEYLVFEERPNPGKKTRVIAVNAVRSGHLLGTIRWWGAWRQYTFMPEPQTVFNNGCLQDIKDCIAGMMSERQR